MNIKSWVAALCAFLLVNVTIAQFSSLQPHAAVWACRWRNVNNWVLDLERIFVDRGTRSSGTNGYRWALGYVKRRVTGSWEAKRWLDWQEQHFKHIYDFSREVWLTSPIGENITVQTLKYNTASNIHGIEGVLIDTRTNTTHGSACLKEQWEGIQAKGKIAIIMRGGCPLAQKVKHARDHGAIAAIIYHHVEDNTGVPGGSLGLENAGHLIPTLLTDYQSGMELNFCVRKGIQCKVRLVVDCVTETRQGTNFIVETKVGDPKSVILVGAHLDTLPLSPGMNDNGSGVAALIEIARAMREYYGFVNKVRFAFWGGYFNGRAGSEHYVSLLAEAHLDWHKFYLDIDMVGAIRPVWTVYSDTRDHKAGSRHMFKFLEINGAKPAYRHFRDSSDYVTFLKRGIPSAGLYTGSGPSIYPCHGLPCDNKRNVNSDTVFEATKAAMYMVSKLALDSSEVPPRVKPFLRSAVVNGTEPRFYGNDTVPQDSEEDRMEYLDRIEGIASF
ncbi:hypothetical protein CDD82_437 [Ophiocordyceps australis]|uniref:Peptide hydrolase n=1 Tax=Ophiocordyceps australis TaxID=1399860 RepID=A0A2C5YZE7_9HYPO|nr:hypothetical protein CDD82_437 [Ophiocordyceps australis]